MFTILVVFVFFLFRCFLFRYFILVMAFKYYGCKCFVKHKRSFQKKLCFLITRSLAGSLHCNIIHHLLFSIVWVNINVCSPFHWRFLDIEQSNIKFVPTTFVKLPYCLTILLKQKRFKRIPNSNDLFVQKKVRQSQRYLVISLHHLFWQMFCCFRCMESNFLYFFPWILESLF